MPNERGKCGHGAQRKILAGFTGLVSITAWYITGRIGILLLPIGVLLGRFFNPDQDAWNKLGDLEGILLLDTFRKAVPHRGRASHTIGVSGLILFAPVVLAVSIGGWALGLTGSFFWSAIFWLTLGVITDNALHITADRIESAYKRHILGRKRISGKRRKW